MEDVIEEIKSLKSKRILFLDPSPTSNRAYAKEFEIFGADVMSDNRDIPDIADIPEVKKDENTIHNSV